MAIGFNRFGFFIDCEDEDAYGEGEGDGGGRDGEGGDFFLNLNVTIVLPLDEIEDPSDLYTIFQKIVPII